MTSYGHVTNMCLLLGVLRFGFQVTVLPKDHLKLVCPSHDMQW